jgi:glycogen synthase
MRIRARDLAVGDIVHINDWHLHVIHIERDRATAVLTAEFAFLIHFAQEDLLTVQARADAA